MCATDMRAQLPTPDADMSSDSLSAEEQECIRQALKDLDPELYKLVQADEEDAPLLPFALARKRLTSLFGKSSTARHDTSLRTLIVPPCTLPEDCDAQPRRSEIHAPDEEPLDAAYVPDDEDSSNSDSDSEAPKYTPRGLLRKVRAARHASMSSMWDRARTRKWRPPNGLYAGDEAHIMRRQFAQEELSKMPLHRSAAGKKRLRDDNKVLKSDGDRQHEKRFAALLICEIIPSSAAKKLGYGEVRTPEKVLDDIIHAIGNLAPGGLISCVDSFLRFISWTQEQGLKFDALTEWHSHQYLKHIHTDATGTTLADDDGLANIAGDEISDSDEEEARDRARGAYAARGQRANLVRLEENFKFPVHMSAATVPVWEGPPLPSAKHALPLDPWEMHALGKYIEDPNTSNVMANIAGTYYASAMAISRAKQMQHMSIENEGDVDADVAYGTARYAKDPLHRGKAQRLIFVKHGVHGSKKWFQRWRSTLRDVRHGQFSYRDFVGGDPRTATTFENCAMPAWKIRKSLRIVLQVACGMSEEKARRYSYHGARHFLTNCSRAKGDPGDTQLELGAWCGSDIALIGQTPREAKQNLRDIQQRETPDRYCAETALRKATRIIADTCQAVADLVRRTPIKPAHILDEGFSLLHPHGSDQ